MTKSRRDAIKKHHDIQACPGSGKTSLVAAKLLILAKKWDRPYQGVCVLSHTNVAKSEIIQKLQLHPAGQIFLQYPHFIGTIQEFVNKFLGIPFCRSSGLKVTHIDDETAIQYMERNLSIKTKNYLDRKHANVNNFIYKYENDTFNLIIPTFTKTSESDSYKNLVSVKQNSIRNGLFFYKEMYEFSSCLLTRNSEIVSAIRKRFPFVIIDEMQDTEKYQDELINQLFLTLMLYTSGLAILIKLFLEMKKTQIQAITIISDFKLYKIATVFALGLPILQKELVAIKLI